MNDYCIDTPSMIFAQNFYYFYPQKSNFGLFRLDIIALFIQWTTSFYYNPVCIVCKKTEL